MTPVLVDTGFLVALFRPADQLAAPATRYLQKHKHPLATVSAVIVETCFSLSPERKSELLSWLGRGSASVVDVPVSAYAQIALTIDKYADRDIDFADAALVWLANQAGANRILTVDQGGFSVLRLKGNRRFELIDWT